MQSALVRCLHFHLHFTRMKLYYTNATATARYSISTLINLDPSAYASDSLAVMRIRDLGSRLHPDGIYAECSMRMCILLR